MKQILFSLLVPLGIHSQAHAGSVVVFNELMYHPQTEEPTFEWLELHNQMAVAVDLSGWSIAGGIDFLFPTGTTIPGGGYKVIAISPDRLTNTSGLTNVLGPFTGRLSNAGESLQLRNNNQRLMDQIDYGVDGEWPVAPDGSGVSLAKRHEHTASAPARNWTTSPLIGGTPGRRNFPEKAFEIIETDPVSITGTWRFQAAHLEPGSDWKEAAFNDSTWSSGEALFQAGSPNLPAGDAEPVPTVFSTGFAPDGSVLPPGSADPHYTLTQSAHSTPPPPAIPATAIQNHPAWLANNLQSSWIGPVNPGTVNSAAGNYTYRTSFSLEGFDPSSALLTFTVAADNRLNDVLFNGASARLSHVGFDRMSSPFNISTGFSPGLNHLDFLVANDGSSPNPSGFRAQLAATARRQFSSGTTLPSDSANYYFRTQFTLEGKPRQSSLSLHAVIADGAVIYLNGAEVLRMNMPDGPITASTPAASNVANPSYAGPFLLPSHALVTGTNTLAVQVHQAEGANHNLLFGADLSLTTTNQLVPPPVTLAFNEFSSAPGTNFWIELINYGASDVDLENYLLTRMGGGVELDFALPPLVLKPGQLVHFPQANLGFGAEPGHRFFLYDPHRTTVLDAFVASRHPRGRWPDGTGRWLNPATLTPGESNHFVFRDEVVLNEIMYHPPDLPPADDASPQQLLLPITADWRYNQSGAEPDAAWQSPAYEDQHWPLSSALFYVENASLPAPKRTPLTLGPSTFYFRTTFDFTGSTTGLALHLRTVLDDGAVFYLNGNEILRINMPAGVVAPETWASSPVGDAAYLGPFTLPTAHLVQGVNVLAVEVHQASPGSSDVVFGAELTARPTAEPGADFQKSRDSWIELFNRSTNPVDLTGWTLSGDIEYNFPDGTILPVGEYLVVAQDPALIRSNYPNATVTGPFDKKLSHSNGLLLLSDPSGNPADEVHFFDGKPWPEYPDGGGSSLELRDPQADNSKAEAWQASRESLRSTWNEYTYRAVAHNVIGPTQWNEFVLGLLDAGECLIDDLSVLESPTGAAVELLQNGSFENNLASWRPLGTHGRSRVIVDPDNPSNHVLHLVASGPTGHMHNHLETTLANNRSVVDGREYQISFRARWLAGNNNLNTRLYFNRAARTTRLAVPQRRGTPGAPNSTLSPNIGPTFHQLSHTPLLPKPDQPVSVHVSAWDPHGISGLTLHWSVNGGSWQQAPMQPTAEATLPGYTRYTGSVPRLPAGTVVQFFVRAADDLGAVSAFPAAGPESRALYKVEDGQPVMPQLHRLRLVMTPADTQFLHTPSNVMSNDRLGLTLIYDEREVFYDVGVHLQGSERGRHSSSRVGFTLRFHADQLFRGVHNGLVADKSGGYSGLGGKHDEILLWHAVNHAGGLPGMYNDLMQVFAPRAQENGTAMVRLAAYGKEFLDSQFKNGSDGHRYKLELIYYPTTTTTGHPEAPKLPQPDNVVNTEIRNWGSDKENYRWIFLQENHEDQDDYSQIIALNQAFSLTGPAFETQTAQLLDVDEWMRALAFLALIGAGDIFTYGLNHNFVIYFRPEDGKAMAFLFDMDFQFVQPTNYSFPGTGSPNTHRLVTLPNNLRRYYNHLHDLTTTTVHSSYLQPWADHYAGLLGENWDGAVNYLVQRANYVRSRMPLSTPFVITNNGGRDFETSNPTVTLRGTAPLPVREISVNGLSYPITWNALTNWALTVPLVDPVNQLTVQGLDNTGNPLPSATATITVTNRGALAMRPVLINEWMADNAGPGGFSDPADGKFQDWFELYNPNDAAADLSGSFLSDSPDSPAQFQIPQGTSIPPRGFLLVWADNEPHQNQADGQGDLHVNFQLSKSGESIGLYAPDGTPQHVVTFESQTENISQGLYPDGDTTSLQFMHDWSPREPNRPGEMRGPQLEELSAGPDGTLTLRFSTVAGRTYQVQYKDDLNAPSWTALASPFTSTGPSLTVTESLDEQPQRFYRVSLLP